MRVEIGDRSENDAFPTAGAAADGDAVSCFDRQVEGPDVQPAQAFEFKQHVMPEFSQNVTPGPSAR